MRIQDLIDRVNLGKKQNNKEIKFQIKDLDEVIQELSKLLLELKDKQPKPETNERVQIIVRPNRSF